MDRIAQSNLHSEPSEQSREYLVVDVVRVKPGMESPTELKEQRVTPPVFFHSKLSQRERGQEIHR